MSKLNQMDTSEGKLVNSSEQLARQLAPHIIELGKACVEFSEVYRATSKDLEGNPESDTDHTVTLSLIACSIAKEYLPELDTGKVAQLALVHDFVEVYAKDTSTVFVDKTPSDKSDREQRALARLKDQFGNVFPWITETIEGYEQLSSPEAKFVKVLDKVMPALTNLLDGGQTFPKIGIHSRDDLARSVNGRRDKIVQYGHSQELAMALRDYFVELMFNTYFPQDGLENK